MMVRNPYFKEWWADAQPDGYADEISYKFGLTDEAADHAIENGQADWTFDAAARRPPQRDRHQVRRPGARQHAVRELVRADEHQHPAVQQQAGAPGGELRDRPQRGRRIFGGPELARRLPDPAAGFPGHVDYCPYTKNPGAASGSAPDLEKAKQLVKESGTAGQKVAIVVADDEVNKAIGTYIQSVLNSIGYKASVKPISCNIQFTYIQNTNNKVQISVTQWYQDYPAASDFLNVLLGCASFHPGSDTSINISGYCNKEIDADMKKALDARHHRPGRRQAVGEGRQGDHGRGAAGRALHPRHVDFVSKRLGNFMCNPQYYCSSIRPGSSRTRSAPGDLGVAEVASSSRRRGPGGPRRRPQPVGARGPAPAAQPDALAALGGLRR